MNAGDIVQIRQFDGATEWIYAKVLDPVTRQVQVQHPGNFEDGKTKVMAAQDIRTKADLLSLTTSAQSVAGNGPLTDAQIATLAASDGWVSQFTKTERAKERATLHTTLVKHYQSQANQLS